MKTPYLFFLFFLLKTTIVGCASTGDNNDVPIDDDIDLDSEDTDCDSLDRNIYYTEDTDTLTEEKETDTIDTEDAGVPDPICGNGVLEEGELCDDGNTDNDDGCAEDCLDQDPNYDCSNPGAPCLVIAICGNGVLEGEEVCDEGDDFLTDGCSPLCDAVTEGWACPRPGRSCMELPICGDGIRARGEQCDDGNTDNDDGCAEDCTQEDGFFCVPGKACVHLACGDGNRTPNEACDDNNENDGDGCSAECVVESGYRCSSLGCSPECGDGVIVLGEACDDGNRESGDGCNVQCMVEPFFSCNSESPNVCATTIECGNGVIEPGEVCDPGISGHDTCYSNGASACKGYENTLVDEPECGNDIIELLEACDGDNSAGCTENCELEEGYACPRAGYCYPVPKCGDGIVQSGESCDVGASASLACNACEVQKGWYCAGSPSECVPSVCQDGFRAPDEQCDDGNDQNNDGCSAACEVETGWICPPGMACITDCGNGVLNGLEACDDGNNTSDDGCHNCSVEAGYDCGEDGTACHLTVCGDTKTEIGEGCDDGNRVAGDGCGPTCQLEPTVNVGSTPTVQMTCGDGLVTSGEQCDDGNTDNDDGCSKACTVESGWRCKDEIAYPDALSIKVTYRDFKQRTRKGGHPHMRNPVNPAPPDGVDLGIVGTPCNSRNTGTCGRLDEDGKPMLAPGNHNTITGNSAGALDWDYHAAAFALWYRDTNTTVLDPISQETGGDTLIDLIVDPEPMPDGGMDVLALTRKDDTSAYVFQSDGNLFYPLGTTRSNTPVDMRGHKCTYNENDNGCGTWDNANRNFHFTSELRYFFQYKGGETLTFFGDDDVWVFVNGRLAVDIGGIHETRWGRVVLGDDGAEGDGEDSNCSINAGDASPSTCPLETAEAEDDDDVRFNLEKGNVYEIVIFQAERSPTMSNYRLTLDGFISPRSFCYTTCGDGIVAGSEACDEGDDNEDGEYGICNTECEFSYCGDKAKNGQEDCDNGLNVDGPWAPSLAAAKAACSSGCTTPGYCGDGILQSAYEVCDDGINDDSYGGCAADCQSLAGYCGDGEVDEGKETCDPKDGLFVTYAADGTGCGYDCQQAPYCGDDIRNGFEQCDGTEKCTDECQYPPSCGDGLLATDGSEICDYGEFAFNPEEEEVYGGCSTECTPGPFCGDSELYTDMEECDMGEANNDNAYNGCTTACTYGPRCGDGVVQTEQGEQCDNGYNEDTYQYVDDACGEGCTATPYCGDGAVQAEFEWCDNGDENNDNAYNGCTTVCHWGPYCGDGTVQDEYETCDNGEENTAYGADADACGYDCQPAPYCGDGIRNGFEICDDGTDENVGGYEKCKPDCTLDAFCGDHVVDTEYGEDCDDGPTGSLTCSTDCKKRGAMV